MARLFQGSNIPPRLRRSVMAWSLAWLLPLLAGIGAAEALEVSLFSPVARVAPGESFEIFVSADPESGTASIGSVTCSIDGLDEAFFTVNGFSSGTVFPDTAYFRAYSSGPQTTLAGVQTPSYFLSTLEILFKMETAVLPGTPIGTYTFTPQAASLQLPGAGYDNLTELPVFKDGSGSAYQEQWVSAFAPMQILVDTLPDVPSHPIPPHLSSDIGMLLPQVEWDGGDADSGDSVTYEVFFGTNPVPATSVGSVTEAGAVGHITIALPPLSPNTDYYWKVVARDSLNQVANGPIWQFQTGNPPTATPTRSPTATSTSTPTPSDTPTPTATNTPCGSVSVGAGPGFHYSTLTEALRVAGPGCEVLVAPGEYSVATGEAFPLVLGAGMRILRADPNSLPRIIGDSSASVFKAENFHDYSTEVNGFFLSGGGGTTYPLSGGGTSIGGGIFYCDNTSLTIKDCVLDEGTAENGGAVYCTGSHPRIERCEFTSNFAFLSGGAIYLEQGSSPELINSLFTGNFSFGDGGSVFTCLGASSATIINATMVFNYSLSLGEVIYADASTPSIINSILWGNPSATVLEVSGAAVTFAYCDGSGIAGTGNIDADPQFVDAFGNDFHLQAGSPAIDAGTADRAPSEDLDGQVRPNPGTGLIDMGAYEFHADFQTRTPTPTQTPSPTTTPPPTLTPTSTPTPTMTPSPTPTPTATFTATNTPTPGPAIPLGTPQNRTISWGQEDFFSVDAVGGKVLSVTVLPAAGQTYPHQLTLYALFGLNPSHFLYQHRGSVRWEPRSQPPLKLLIQPTEAGKYHFMLYSMPLENHGSSQVAYRILIEYVDLTLQGVAPFRAQIERPNQFIVEGSGITASTQFWFHAHILWFEITQPATVVSVTGDGRALLTSNFPGSYPGLYDLHASNGTGQAMLPGAVQLDYSLVGPQLKMFFRVPPMRAGIPDQLGLRYLNRGDAAALAPVIEITAYHARIKLLETDEWTRDPIQLVAIYTGKNGPAGLIPPFHGENYFQVPFYLWPDQDFGQPGTEPVAIVARKILPSQAGIPWPPEYQAAFGTTVTQYLEAMARSATRIGILGGAAFDMRRVFQLPLNEPTSNISGIVRNQSSQPLPGVNLRALDSGGALAGEGQAGDNGNYIIWDLDPGVYTLEPDGRTALQETHVTVNYNNDATGVEVRVGQ